MGGRSIFLSRVCLYIVYSPYSCESDNLRALLDLGLGKDLSAELSTPAYRSAMEQLLQHHKLGKYLSNQSASEEKVRDFPAESIKKAIH